MVEFCHEDQLAVQKNTDPPLKAIAPENTKAVDGAHVVGGQQCVTAPLAADEVLIAQCKVHLKAIFHIVVSGR